MKSKIRIELLVHGIAAFSLLFALASCGKDDDDANALASTKSAVALSEAVAPEGCLSIPLYNQQIRTLNPHLTMLEATTKMSFSAKKAIRHNYELLSSLGGFQYGEVGIYKLQQLQNVTQAGCDSFIFSDPDGAQKLYQVKDKSQDYITGETDKGERITYRWLSPTQMEITKRFISYDVPCGSEKNAIFVDQTKIYDWSGAVPSQVASDSRLTVDRAFLDRIAEATGKNINEFYAPDSTDIELTDQLRNIPNIAPRADLLACTVAPPPPEEPHDGDGNGDNSGGSGEDNGGGSADNGNGTGDGTTPPPPPSDGTPPPPATPHHGVAAS